LLDPRDHIANVLIALSAARLQGEVVSANARHMQQWVRLAQGAGLDVVRAYCSQNIHSAKKRQFLFLQEAAAAGLAVLFHGSRTPSALD
jgi:hypothetical protein